MTTRLYYDDCETTTFDAVVVQCVPAGDRFEVTLDRTAFYPTSGGQPFDTGQLGSADVVEVIDRESGAVSHIVTTPLGVGTTVSGVVDAFRRHDHMEQHTGQHVLSAALERTCGVATVGFHMGAELSTIDLAREVTADELREAETTANRVVRENRPVKIRIVAESEVATLPLRRAPTRAGDLRIVEIADFDVSACGGTHVSQTGAIGQVAVVGTEKVRGGTRVTFVCGGRALDALRARRDKLAEIGRLLGVAPLDAVSHVERLLGETRERERATRRLRAALAEYQAAAWREQAETIGPFRVVIRATDLDGADLKSLAQAVVAGPGVVAIVTGVGTPVPIVAARSADVIFDAGAVVKAVAAALGGRGGGRPELAQGGITSTAADVENFVRRHLREGNNGS